MWAREGSCATAQVGPGASEREGKQLRAKYNQSAAFLWQQSEAGACREASVPVLCLQSGAGTGHKQGGKPRPAVAH